MRAWKAVCWMSVLATSFLYRKHRQHPFNTHKISACAKSKHVMGLGKAGMDGFARADWKCIHLSPALLICSDLYYRGRP